MKNNLLLSLKSFVKALLDKVRGFFLFDRESGDTVDYISGGEALPQPFDVEAETEAVIRLQTEI